MLVLSLNVNAAQFVSIRSGCFTKVLADRCPQTQYRSRKVRLTEVFRQAAQSRIVTSAHRINQGSIPDLSPPGTESDFYFVQADDPETAVPRIIELVKTRIPKRFGLDPIRDIQVLCPMNRGGVGARSLNIELQAALNPASDRKVERFGWTFAPGDKVMQIENDYDKEVYNGDIGYIDDVDPNAGEVVASFNCRTGPTDRADPDAWRRCLQAQCGRRGAKTVAPSAPSRCSESRMPGPAFRNRPARVAPRVCQGGRASPRRRARAGRSRKGRRRESRHARPARNAADSKSVSPRSSTTSPSSVMDLAGTTSSASTILGTLSAQSRRLRL